MSAEDGHLYECTLADGRIAAVFPLTFGQGRIVCARPVVWHGRGYDDVW